MEEIRISAKTLDEAKTQALLKLNTSSDNIEFKVIEEGSTGLLGFIGSKPWVISARVKTEDEIAAQAAQAAKDEADRKAEAEKKVAEARKAEEARKAAEERKAAEAKKADEIRKAAEAKKAAEEEKSGTFTEAAVGLSEEKETCKKADNVISDAEEAGGLCKSGGDEKAASDSETIEPVSEEEAAELVARGEDFLKSILSVMDIKADIKAEFNHATNEIYYEFNGEEMGVLIGKRGQTLDSLQYLVSLVVNKHRSGYIRVKLDTENYRDRRKLKLEELAHNIASKVKRSRRRVELEPMNPYERRIIHSALQGDPYVTTISEGEEPYRHVVVILKRDNNRRRYNNGSSRESGNGGYSGRSRGYGRGERTYGRGHDKQKDAEQ